MVFQIVDVFRVFLLLLQMVWDVLLANVRFASCEGMKMQDCDDDFKTQHLVIVPLRILRQTGIYLVCVRL